MRKIFTIVAGSITAAAVCSSSQAASSYSTGFEDFTLGPISSGVAGPSQNGWSGGAQGGFTNNDAGDEQVVNTVVQSGVQSWHYARGYNSPGQGTPYTPNVDAVDTAGESMSGSIWFKAHTSADNSSFAIETGNVAGDDRAEILAYVENLAGGLTIRSFTGSGFTGVPIASGLDASAWHSLAFSLAYTGADNKLSISVDGGSPVLFDGSLKDWRDANSLAFSESSRLKLRPRHADGDPSFNGFYIDDISYAVVPEPTGLGLLALGGIALLGRRGRRTSAR